MGDMLRFTICAMARSGGLRAVADNRVLTRRRTP